MDKDNVFRPKVSDVRRKNRPKSEKVANLTLHCLPLTPGSLFVLLYRSEKGTNRVRRKRVFNQKRNIIVVDYLRVKRQLHTRVRKPFINNTLSIHYHFSEKFLNAYGKNGRSKRKLSHTFANATRTKHRCILNNTMKIAAEVFLASSQRKLIYLQHKKEKIMGTIKQGILGGFSGKVGTVVGSTWKSVHYMRALAVSFSDPRTEKQKNQRSKFTAAVNFTKAMTPFLRFGYKEFSGQQSAFNAAVSYILKHAMKGSGRNVSIDYNKALVTRGSLVPALDATVTVNESKVTFAWTDNSGMGDATVTDAAMLLAYNKDKGMAVYDIAAATRSDAKAELKLPANWKDDALAIYLGFCNEDVTNVANSVCLQDTPVSEGSEGDGSEGGGSGDGGLDENPLG